MASARSTLGFAVRAVLDECAGGDVSRFRCVRARFAAPVLPGQTLRTRMWRTSAPGAPARIVFETVVFETGARKRMRFERALGASVSLEDVSLQLEAEFACV